MSAEEYAEAARRLREQDMKSRQLYTPAEQNLKWNYDNQGRVQDPRYSADGPFRGPVDPEGFPAPVKAIPGGPLPEEPVPEIIGPPNPPMPSGVAHQERHELDERLREVRSKMIEENGKRFTLKEAAVAATTPPLGANRPPNVKPEIFGVRTVEPSPTLNAAEPVVELTPGGRIVPPTETGGPPLRTNHLAKMKSLDERLREVASKIKEEDGKRYSFGKTREQIAATVIPANQTAPPIGGSQSEQPLNPVDVVSQTPQSSAEPTSTEPTDTSTASGAVSAGQTALANAGLSNFAVGEVTLSPGKTQLEIGFTYGGLNYSYNSPVPMNPDGTPDVDTAYSNMANEWAEGGIPGLLANSTVMNPNAASPFQQQNPTLNTGPLAEPPGSPELGPINPNTQGGAGPTTLAPGDITTINTRIGTDPTTGQPMYSTTTITNTTDEPVTIDPLNGTVITGTLPPGAITTTQVTGEPTGQPSGPQLGSPTPAEETPAGFTSEPASPLSSDTEITGPTDVSAPQQAQIGASLGGGTAAGAKAASAGAKASPSPVGPTRMNTFGGGGKGGG
jgi:hypothetical protein